MNQMPEVSQEWSYAQSVRVKIGLKKAIQNGKKLGRPSTIDFKSIAQEIYPFYIAGLTYRQIEKITGVKKSYAHRAIKKYAEFLTYISGWELKKTDSILNKLNEEIKNEH